MPYIVTTEAIQVRGYKELSKALERVGGQERANFGVSYELKNRLRTIGEKVAKAAPQYVTHKTGRHGDPAVPRLEDSVRVSVTQKAAAVYSTAIHGGVQNVGGGPHAGGWAGRGPHVRRADASRWMIKAVASQRAETEKELDGLVDWVVRELERP